MLNLSSEIKQLKREIAALEYFIGDGMFMTLEERDDHFEAKGQLEILKRWLDFCYNLLGD